MKREFLMIGGILFIIAFYFILLKYSHQIHNAQTCENLSDFEKEEYSGIVSQKFIDKKNHCFRTINFTNTNHWVLVDDTTDFYDFTDINDSVVKKRGTDTVIIYRNGSVFKFKIHFGCLN